MSGDSFLKAEGFVERGASDFVSDQNAKPALIDGTLYLPSCSFAVADQADDSGNRFVSIMLAGGKVGLYHSLTTEGAREVADAIHRAANEAEAAVAKQATAAIDKARGK